MPLGLCSGNSSVDYSDCVFVNPESVELTAHHPTNICGVVAGAGNAAPNGYDQVFVNLVDRTLADDRNGPQAIDDTRFESGFLAHLAHDGLFKTLAHPYAPAGQGPSPETWRLGAPNQ